MSSLDRSEPKLLFPGLAGFYAAVSELWYPMIRVTVGAILLVHGGIIMFAIALRGGGPYSLDRVIGKEL